MDDPTRVEWLVERAAVARDPIEFATAMLTHLVTATRTDTGALWLEGTSGEETFHLSGAGELAEADAASLKERMRSREASATATEIIHRFRRRYTSGAIALRPPVSPETLEPLMRVALDLLDLCAELRIVREEALQDPLTGLLNRRAMTRSLGRAIAEGNRYEGRTFSLAMLDLDHFKWFNDTYGHPVGDELLAELARVLSSSLRRSDLASRWGGDEFLLLLPETQDDEVALVIGRVDRELRDFLTRYSREGVELGFSAGVARFPEDGRDADTLIRHADERLYEQKQRIPTPGEWEST